jgi:hypothetical protein
VTNTLAYLTSLSVTTEKSFIRLTLGQRRQERLEVEPFRNCSGVDASVEQTLVDDFNVFKVVAVGALDDVTGEDDDVSENGFHFVAVQFHLDQF